MTREMSNSFRILVGKPEGRRTLGRQRCRWVDIKMGLTDIGLCGLDLIGLAEDRDQWRTVAKLVMNILV
jgi:hypothetical protein